MSASGAGYAIVVVETTGLIVGSDRVVEIAVVRTDLCGEYQDEWSTLVNPGVPVRATRKHGLTSADVAEAPTFDELIGTLNSLIAGRVLVAHYARFHLAVLADEYERAGWQIPPSTPCACTWDAGRVFLRRHLPRDLKECSSILGIEYEEPHSALSDARATARLARAYLSVQPLPPQLAGSMWDPETVRHACPGPPWPDIPVGPVAVRRRRPRNEIPVPASPITVAALFQRLPRSSSNQEPDASAADAYLGLLTEVLDDEVMTDDEAKQLVASAESWGLTFDDVAELHRRFVASIAERMANQAVNPHPETGHLLALAGYLLVPGTEATAMLETAQTAWRDKLRTRCRPLPPHVAPDAALRLGDELVFTGGSPLEHMRLQMRAWMAGLVVRRGEVSRSTTALVVGTDPAISKLNDAERYSTRRLTFDEFAELVEYVQP